MSFLYWLYLWQLKEYRRDRMRVHLQASPLRVLVRLWLVGEWRRPQVTVKVLVASVLSLALLFLEAVWLLGLGSVWVTLVVVYLTVPLAVALTVVILVIPSRLIVAIVTYLAMQKRQKLPELMVIGVTGSYGKTTTKEAIADLLSVKFKILCTPGGVNTRLGIARQVLSELRADTQVYVVEMGAYQRGEIAELVRLLRPQIGVLTGINEQHLALFGSLENIKEAKLELLIGLPPDGLAIMNMADPNVASLKGRVLVRIVPYHSTRPEENIRAAVKLAEYLGLSCEEIERGKRKLSSVEKRMGMKKGIQGSTIIDDTYSSNPNGFRVTLSSLKDYPAETKILVTTGIYELGAAAERINRSLYDQAKEICQAVILTESLHAKYYPSAELVTSENVLFDLIVNLAGPKTVVVFEGRGRIINQVLPKILSHQPYETPSVS